MAILSILHDARVTAADNCWVPLMNLMILGCFLCEQPLGICPYRLVSIVNQVREGASPYIVVLAETLIKLDNFAKGEAEAGGSSLLLYLWLGEKVKMFLPPVVRKYHPGGFRSRPKDQILYKEFSMNMWVEILSSLGHHQIQWATPKLNISEYLIKTGQAGVMLLGISRFIWIQP